MVSLPFALWMFLAGQTPASQPATTPATQPAVASRSLELVLSPASRVQSAELLTRAGKVAAPPTKVVDGDRATWTFAGLDPAQRHTVTLRLAGGGIVQGVDLAPGEDKLDALARQRRPAAQPAHEFTAEDEQALREQVEGVEEFEDQVRVLRVAGDGDRAGVLVEKIRTRGYYAGKGGNVIWRVEVWVFDYRYGGWVKRSNVERILVREELPGRDLQARTHLFDPALGGVTVPTDGPGTRVEYRLAEPLDPTLGRTPASPIQWRPSGAKE